MHSPRPGSEPRQMADGMWNCSDDADLPLHFACDLVPQCSGREDEGRCFYTTARCGIGRQEVGGTCYQYVPPTKKSRWDDAHAYCSGLGAVVACFEGWREWRDVLKVVNRPDYRLIYVGLKTTDYFLPAM